MRFFCFSWLEKVGAVGCLLLFLFSCKSQQVINEVHTDTVTVYRDTTIFIEGRVDTFTVESICYDTIIKNEKGNSIQIIKLPNDKTQIICHEADLRLQLDSVISLTKINHSEQKTIFIERCTNQMHQFLIKLFYLLIFISLLYIAYRIRK